MKYTTRLEEALDDVLVKNFPHRLSKATCGTLAAIAPWLLGVAGLFLTYGIWTNRFEFLPSVIMSGSIGVLYLIAFPSLMARRKVGWDLVFYAALIDLLNGVVETIRGDYFIISLAALALGQFIGFYLLFQIRSEYHTGKKKNQDNDAVPEL